MFFLSQTFRLVRLSDIAQKQPKTQKMHFCLVLSLHETIYVEPHQCFLILLTLGPKPEIFTKTFWELAILKNSVFLSWPFWILFSNKHIFLLHPQENESKLLGYQGWVSIFWWLLPYPAKYHLTQTFLPPAVQCTRINVWFKKNRTIHKISLWLYYDCFG